MFGPNGNPQARNLFSVIGYLQKRAGVRLHETGSHDGYTAYAIRIGARRIPASCCAR